MQTELNNNDLYKLEKLLSDFESEFEALQAERASKWRIHFILSFCISAIITFMEPAYGWLALAVVGYFAGSLFSMLRQRAKASLQISEYQQQLKLTKLLKQFQASSCS